jgi:hypothetical protein
MKARLEAVSRLRWAFYEAMYADDKETMADWFETLYIHYQNRGKQLKRLRDGYTTK